MRHLVRERTGNVRGATASRAGKGTRGAASLRAEHQRDVRSGVGTAVEPLNVFTSSTRLQLRV